MAISSDSGRVYQGLTPPPPIQSRLRARTPGRATLPAAGSAEPAPRPAPRWPPASVDAAGLLGLADARRAVAPRRPAARPARRACRRRRPRARRTRAAATAACSAAASEPAGALEAGSAAQGCGRGVPPAGAGAAPPPPARPTTKARRSPPRAALHVLLHHDVLAEPQDGLQRRLQRLQGLADHDARSSRCRGGASPAPAARPRGGPSPRRPDGSEAITVRGTGTPLAESSCSTRILLRASADGRRAVQHREPEELQVVHHREAVLADGGRDARHDHVGGREGAPAGGRPPGPSRPSRISTCERVDHPRHVAAGAGRLDDPPGGEDCRPSGRGR